jgi:hypothetical protein
LDITGSTGTGGGSEIEAEIDNISAAPLPPALPMFGVALIGLAAFAWRREFQAG